MSANYTGNTQSLIRSELWQRQLEEILHEQLLGTPFVRQIDFPDGSAMTFPSMGSAVVRDLPENSEVTFDAVDTTEQQMTLNDPVVAANSISEILLEDSMWASDMLSKIPQEQATAIMERFETDVLSLANSQSGGLGNANNINGTAHRLAASGTNQVIAVEDFAKARYSLTKAKVPTTNLVAIVDPSVAYELETSAQLVNVSNNPRWEGIVETGIQNNMRFIRNVYGFDCYESNLLPTQSVSETIGATTVTNPVTNIFMSASNERLLPFCLAWKRRAKMDRDFDFKLREEQIITTARWGTKLIREDNLVTIVSDNAQV